MAEFCIYNNSIQDSYTIGTIRRENNNNNNSYKSREIGRILSHYPNTNNINNDCLDNGEDNGDMRQQHQRQGEVSNGNNSNIMMSTMDVTATELGAPW